MDEYNVIEYAEIKGLIMPVIFIILTFVVVIMAWPFTDMYREQKEYERTQVLEIIRANYGSMDFLIRDDLINKYGFTNDELDTKKRLWEAFSNED